MRTFNYTISICAIVPEGIENPDLFGNIGDVVAKAPGVEIVSFATDSAEASPQGDE